MKLAAPDAKAMWFGSIPPDWRMIKLKYLATFRSGDGITSERIETEGNYPVYGGNGLRGYTDSFTHNGDHILIGRQGALCGNINYASGKFWASEHAVVVTPRPGIALRWMGELLRSMNLLQYSQSAAQPGLSVDFIVNLTVPIPSPEEQQAISAFLDCKTAKIDALIAKKQRLIELLQEKRTALISHAVTRGLDPCVPMKNSGVEWANRIPSTWKILRNGNLFTDRDERGFPDLPILEVSIRTGCTERQFSDEHVEQRAEDPGTYKRATCGDIVFNKMRLWQGAVGVAPMDGLVSPDYTVARPCSGAHAEYYEYLFRTNVYMNEVNRYSHGIVKDRNRLYWNDFKQMPSLVPPLNEQVQIAIEVREITTKIDSLTTKVEDGIGRLQEYRTALISAAVTGKINARGEVG